ncbi:MAG: carboxypeptidase regulatory-like domain-containing protein [Clostridia bacterium]|nr:carboxypeptidase regulatory-like domain-containing protein [Clostridia bacterium]
MPDSYGTLRVRAYTAGGALPVEGAVVRVLGAGEDNRLVSFSSLTDRDGLSDRFMLPAPPVEYSLTPSPAELPYSVYDIEISKRGYLTKRIRGLTVFSGINSIQLIDMIPGSGNVIQDYPRGNINYIIPENQDLQ